MGRIPILHFFHLISAVCTLLSLNNPVAFLFLFLTCTSPPFPVCIPIHHTSALIFGGRWGCAELYMLSDSQGTVTGHMTALGFASIIRM